MKKVLASVLVLFTATSLVCAQGNKANRPSPPDSTTGKIGNATISVNYGSPSLKGRKLGTDLAPYNKIWRAGANEATIFQTDKNIKVEGKDLPAGKYSLFITPTENEWQFTFNSETGQWGIKRSGEANLDPAKNVLTVSAKTKKSASANERLVYQVTKSGLVVKWENTEVPLSIK
ncbi:MAG: DUF2911 domain-containing protein [Williamsia sp.]|nr:DUF2911 domain-containing protein [Williamsia sp.]